MEILPAIDLRGGRVVRLTQGDYARETLFAQDPVAVARGFVEAGATRIHVVDLDGALSGGPDQARLCAAIALAVPVPIELGGGLRSEEDVSRALDVGIERVVLGTAAVRDPGLVSALVAKHGAERIVVGVDARDGQVAVSGWTDQTAVSVEALVDDMAARGVRRFIYTDIARDGMLSEPNVESTAALVRHAATHGAKVISSGGVGSIEHLLRLADAGCEGAIVGSAIYRGAFELADAIAALRTR